MATSSFPTSSAPKSSNPFTSPKAPAPAPSIPSFRGGGVVAPVGGQPKSSPSGNVSTPSTPSVPSFRGGGVVAPVGGGGSSSPSPQSSQPQQVSQPSSSVVQSAQSRATSSIPTALASVPASSLQQNYQKSMSQDRGGSFISAAKSDVSNPESYKAGYGKEVGRVATATERANLGEQIGPRVTGTTGQFAFTQSGRGTIQQKQEVTIGAAAMERVNVLENQAKAIVQQTFNQKAGELMPLAQTRIDERYNQLQSQVNNGQISVEAANSELKNLSSQVSTQVNIEAQKYVEQTLPSNPQYQNVQRSYQQVGQKYGLSQDVYGQKYFANLEGTKIQARQEAVKTALEVGASFIPQAAPLFLGQAMKETQREPLVIPSSNISLSNINLASTKQTASANKYLALGLGPTLLGIPGKATQLGREVTLARIEELQNVKPKVSLGIRQTSEQGFMDTLRGIQKTSSGSIKTKVITFGKEIKPGVSVTAGKTSAKLEVLDFLTGKTIKSVSLGEAKGVSQSLQYPGQISATKAGIKTSAKLGEEFQPSFSVVGSKITSTATKQGNILKAKIFKFPETKYSAIGGITKKSGDILKSMTGKAIETPRGFTFDVEALTGVKEVGANPISFETLSGGKSITTTAKSQISLADEINKIVSSQASKQTAKQISESTFNIPLSRTTAITSKSLIKDLDRPSVNVARLSYAVGVQVKSKQTQAPIVSTSAITIQDLFGSQRNKVALNTATATTQMINQLNRQTTKQLSGQTFATPNMFAPISPVIAINPIPFADLFPQPGGGLGEGKKNYEVKKTKRKPGYTASFGAAFFDISQKVTKKQLAKLNKATYSGFEMRPLLQIVSGKKKKK